MSKLCSINVLFNQYHVGKKSNKTLIEQNLDTNLVRLMLISTFYVLRKCLKTTYSSIVKLNQMNYRRKNCRMSHLLRIQGVPFKSCLFKKISQLWEAVQKYGSTNTYITLQIVKLSFRYKYLNCKFNWKKVTITYTSTANAGSRLSVNISTNARMIIQYRLRQSTHLWEVGVGHDPIDVGARTDPRGRDQLHPAILDDRATVVVGWKIVNLTLHSSIILENKTKTKLFYSVLFEYLLLILFVVLETVLLM